MVSYEQTRSMPVMAIPQNLRVSALVEYSSPYRDPATALAFVDTGDVQKMSNGSKAAK
jgi:hypothetical protein